MRSASSRTWLRSCPGSGHWFHGSCSGASPDLEVQTKGLIYAFAPEQSSTVARLRGVRKTVNRLLSEQKPDILASHFAFYTAPILPRLRERPFFMHFHGPWALELEVEGASKFATGIRRRIERSVYDRAYRMIVLSKAFAQLLCKEYEIPEDRIRIVPGSVDLDRFAPIVRIREAARGSLGWPSDRPILFACVRHVW